MTTYCDRYVTGYREGVGLGSVWGGVGRGEGGGRTEFGDWKYWKSRICCCMIVNGFNLVVVLEFVRYFGVV